MFDVMSFAARRAALVAMVYFAFAVLWIQYSDAWLFALNLSFDELRRLQTLKGSFFVGFTSLLILGGCIAVLAPLQRKRQEIKRMHDREALALDAAGEGLWEWDLSTGQVYASPRLMQLVGRPKEQQIGDYSLFTQLLHEQDRVLFKQRLMEKIKGQRKDFVMTHRLATPEGQWRWFYTRGRCLRDNNGRVLRMVGISSDITVEREQRHRLMQAQAVMDSSEEGIIVSDANSVILTVNHAFERISGYRAQDIVGRTESQLRSGHHDDAFYCVMELELATKGFWRGKMMSRRANGEVYPLIRTVRLVCDEDANPLFYVSVFSDLTQVETDQAEREQLLHIDSLTRLPNRLLLSTLLAQAQQSVARGQQAAAFVLIDLDRFTVINQGLGTRRADELLCQVASRLRGLVGAQEAVGRLAGDQFGLILRGPWPQGGLTARLNGLLASFSAPFSIDADAIYVSLSVGAVAFSNASLEVGHLIMQAETAMRAAKAQGGARFVQGCTGNDEDGSRLKMEMALREGIQRDELRMFLQPIVDAHSAEVKGYEALVRWQHPSEGLLAPGQFLPLASECGLIPPIDQWVLVAAVKQLAQWQAQGRAGFISVNASSLLADDLALDEWLQDLLHTHGVPGERLVIEVVEELLCGSDDSVARRLHNLRELGVDASIDDFGTGQSSLARLHALPVRKLKIDRSFVLNLEHEEVARVMVRTIVLMAGSLNLSVVAEGVETEQQRALLAQMGCDLLQGYLFGKPVPVSELPQ